jgi:hypothetical protein
MYETRRMREVVSEREEHERRRVSELDLCGSRAESSPRCVQDSAGASTDCNSPIRPSIVPRCR